MNIVALIPARANSQRYHGKNYANFHGKPLFMHSVVFAKCSFVVDKYFVTTNDDYILDYCKNNGILCIHRPDEYSTAVSPSSEYVAHFLDVLRIKEGKFPDALLILQPTNPIREHIFLEAMVRLYQKHKADCVFTAVKSKSKIGRIIDGLFIPFNYRFEQRSQDMEEFYEENGMFYLVNVASFLKNGTLHGKVNIPYIIPDHYRNIDIDTKLEMNITELIYEKVSSDKGVK